MTKSFTFFSNLQSLSKMNFHLKQISVRFTNPSFSEETVLFLNTIILSDSENRTFRLKNIFGFQFHFNN